jgi:hypothetical protein
MVRWLCLRLPIRAERSSRREEAAIAIAKKGTAKAAIAKTPECPVSDGCPSPERVDSDQNQNDPKNSTASLHHHDEEDAAFVPTADPAHPPIIDTIAK